jgi:NAD+ synthase
MKREYTFDVETVTNDCIQWIKDWFENNGPGCNAVLGLSGGKDSTIVAALCAKALGPDRVIGVAMPDKGQGINEADKICKYLGIKYMFCPIDCIVAEFHKMWEDQGSNVGWSEQAEQNIPPRVRMTMLYAVSQTFNGRVANTCNLSEDFVGYSSLFGDNAGSFAPLSKLTVTEIYQIGDYLGIPYEWVHKVPDDGLPHSSSDEKKFGFSYAEVDRYIREGIVPEGACENNPDELKVDKIDRMHRNNKFKTEIVQIPHFDPLVEVFDLEM